MLVDGSKDATGPDGESADDYEDVAPFEQRPTVGVEHSIVVADLDIFVVSLFLGRTADPFMDFPSFPLDCNGASGHGEAEHAHSDKQGELRATFCVHETRAAAVEDPFDHETRPHRDHEYYAVLPEIAPKARPLLIFANILGHTKARSSEGRVEEMEQLENQQDADQDNPDPERRAAITPSFLRFKFLEMSPDREIEQQIHGHHPTQSIDIRPFEVRPVRADFHCFPGCEGLAAHSRHQILCKFDGERARGDSEQPPEKPSKEGNFC